LRADTQAAGAVDRHLDGGGFAQVLQARLLDVAQDGDQKAAFLDHHLQLLQVLEGNAQPGPDPFDGVGARQVGDRDVARLREQQPAPCIDLKRFLERGFAGNVNRHHIAGTQGILLGGESRRREPQKNTQQQETDHGRPSLSLAASRSAASVSFPRSRDRMSANIVSSRARSAFAACENPPFNARAARFH